MSVTMKPNANDAWTVRGEQAFSELRAQAQENWEAMTGDKRLEFGSTGPEAGLTMAAHVLRRIQLLGVRRRFWGRVRSPTVAERLELTGLPHLAPEGPAAEREKERRGPRERAIVLRAFDDRESALRYGQDQSFEIRELEAASATVEKLQEHIKNLKVTPLVNRRVLRALPTAGRKIDALAEGLRWYRETFLPCVIEQASKIRARDLQETRHIVLDLVTYIEKATGLGQSKCLELLSDLLNWKAPRGSDDASESGNPDEWTTRLLRRWTEEADVSRVSS